MLSGAEFADQMRAMRGMPRKNAEWSYLPSNSWGVASDWNAELVDYYLLLKAMAELAEIPQPESVATHNDSYNKSSITLSWKGRVSLIVSFCSKALPPFRVSMLDGKGIVDLSNAGVQNVIDKLRSLFER